jgi:hypothetical protein
VGHPGGLRHLGIRRAWLVAEQTAQVQQMRDLLECAWPAVLDAARQPFKSTTWHAALTVALARAAGGDLSRVSRLGVRRFDAAVRRQVARLEAVHPCRKIIAAVFTSCADPAGVTAMRCGALERVGLLADWRDTQARLADTEQRMVTVYLTSREHNKLSTGQAHAVLAATLLRHLHAVITIGQRWDPAIAASGGHASR